jgi:hypothetical protein
MAKLRMWPAVLAVLVLGAAAPSAPAQVPPGFQTDLHGKRTGVHVECLTRGSALTCLLYGAPQRVPGTCDIGGLVPTVTLASGGRPAHGTICVDEAFHGWKVLRAGREWRARGFRCRTHLRLVNRRVVGRLECFAGEPRGFAVTGNGAVNLDASPARRRTVRSCGAIAFERDTDNGVFGIQAQGTGCVTARRLARATRTRGVGRTPYRYNLAGFTCRGTETLNVLPTVRWACVKRRAIVIFERS